MTSSPLSPKEIEAIRYRLAHPSTTNGMQSLSDIAALLYHIARLEEQLKIRSPHFTGEADPAEVAG